jgi:hypothetical protein
MILVILPSVLLLESGGKRRGCGFPLERLGYAT